MIERLALISEYMISYAYTSTGDILLTQTDLISGWEVYGRVKEFSDLHFEITKGWKADIPLFVWERFREDESERTEPEIFLADDQEKLRDEYPEFFI